MKLEELIHRVIDLSDEENYAEALKLCASILEVDASYDRVYFERGMIYLNLEKDELALVDFENLLKINPEYPGGKEWYAKTLAGLGKKVEAAFIQWEQLKSQPQGKYGMGVSPNDWAKCAQNFIEAGKKELAQSVIEEYFSRYEKNVSSYKTYETAPIRIYARLLMDANQHERALTQAVKAIQSEHVVPADFEVYIEALIENNHQEQAAIEISNYVSEIHDGYETPGIIELKKRLP